MGERVRYLELNGVPVPDAAARLIPVTYGHFTAMQVRGGAVAGWPLHLKRLAAASVEMFGTAVPDERVHDLAAGAVKDRPDASMRIMMVPPVSGIPMPGAPAEPDVLVVVTDPVADSPQPPLRVCSQVYERELPHVKHLATMGLVQAERRAVADGFDDALFVDRDGLVLEASIWNVAFWDGSAVVWPRAPMLTGITMLLMRQALSSNGIPQRTQPVRQADLAGFRAAFFTNSECARQPVASVDDVVFRGDPALTKILDAAWDSFTWHKL